MAHVYSAVDCHVVVVKLRVLDATVGGVPQSTIVHAAGAPVTVLPVYPSVHTQRQVPGVFSHRCPSPGHGVESSHSLISLQVGGAVHAPVAEQVTDADPIRLNPELHVYPAVAPNVVTPNVDEPFTTAGGKPQSRTTHVAALPDQTPFA